MIIAAAVVIAAAVYVAWGVIHHAHHGDLHLKIVLEYLALALLGVVIIYIVTQSL